MTPYNSNGSGGTTSGTARTLKRVIDTFGQFTDENAKTTKFEANGLGHITEIIDPYNKSTKFDRDPSEGWITKITTADPDDAGSLLALEITYTYSNDGRGNRLTETRRAAGSTTVLAQQTWEYGNTDYSVPTKRTDELGRVTKYTIGAKSPLTNGSGKVLSMTQIVGIEDNSNATETDDATTNYTYTTVAGHAGLLSTATDALGRVTSYEYWTTNPHEGLLKKITYSDGTNVEHEYDDFRNRDATLDELDHRTEFLFDKLDRLIKRTDADPDAGGGTYVSPETELAYDAAGNLIKTTDPLDNFTRSVYDRRNRLIYEIAPRPDSSTAYTHTIDDEDAGFTMTANWYDWTTSQSYNGDYQYHGSAPGSSDSALWEFGSLDKERNYEIFVSWPVFSGNAPDTPYEILDVNSAVLKTMTLDQNPAPADEIVGGIAWQRLGVFAGSTGYKVKVKPGSGWVGADAARIVEVGPTVKYEYDPAGNLLKSADALGNTTAFAYDDMNRRTSVTLTDPDGVGSGDPAPVYETQYYNNGLVKKEIDALDNETLYEPDTLGRTVKIQAPDPAGGTNYTITRYTYNPAGETTSMTDPEGRVSFYDYHDSLHQATMIAPAPGTSPYNVVKDDDDATYQATTGYFWTDNDPASGAYGSDHHSTADAAHLYLATWSFTGLTVGKEYQVLVTWKADAANATNALFEVWDGAAKENSTRVNQQLAPADWQDINDNNTLWERLIVFKADSTSASVKLWNTGVTTGTVVADAVRVREVGTVERTTRNKVGNVTASVDGLGNETISLYDRRGRQTSVYEPLRDTGFTPWRPAPVDNPSSSDWTTVSDSRAYGGSYLRASSGSSSYPTYTMAVPSLSYYPTLAVMATWTPDAANISNAQFKVYDNFNNLIATISVDQTVAPGDYRDETGRWWAVLGVYQMIPFVTTVKVSPQVGAQADAARVVEVGDRSFKNTYNAAGELTQVTDAKNNDTWFYRDDLGRVKEEKNELNKSRLFEFYADSRLKKATDRTGRVIEHFYDNLGRQKEELWKDSSGNPMRSMTFGYYADGELKNTTDNGTNARAYDWVYDKIGRLDETKFSAGGYSWEFDSDYDDNSNRDKRELLRSGTSQFIDTFEFDDLNRQTKLTRDAVNWGHDLRAEFTYKADGQFDQIKRFNVLTGGTAFVTSHYGYDGMGRLNSLDHKNSSSTSITGYGWTYDTAGRMESMNFTNANYDAEDVSKFGYDRTNQLLTGERTGTTNDEAYVYDSAGNRTTANGATYTTSTNNRLTNDGTFSYTYDDEGNRKKKITLVAGQPTGATTFYDWDHRNRLVKVTKRIGPNDTDTVTETIDLDYDFGNRLTRRDHDPDGPGGTAVRTDHYLWDGYELVGVTGYNSLVFAHGPAPDMVLFESATTLHALLGDHLNTVRDVISTSGTLENHLVYNSYGELKSQTPGGYSPFHRFTGKPFDVAVGLQYNVNRWYDPVTGRWTSEDPIGFAGRHPNLSAYIGNSPLAGVDSYGLFPFEPEPQPGPGIQVPVYQSREGFRPGYPPSDVGLQGIVDPPASLTAAVFDMLGPSDLSQGPLFDYGISDEDVQLIQE